MKNPTFSGLVAAVRAGDQQAAEAVVRAYEPYIRKVIGLRLKNTNARRVLDSLDICQSVLGLFFARVRAGQFELPAPEDLRKLLVTMALNKLRDAIRRESKHAGGLADDWDQVNAEETPSQWLENQDLADAIRSRLSETECWLFDQRAEGRSWAEMAQERGNSPAALRMQLVRAIARVQREFPTDEVRHEP